MAVGYSVLLIILFFFIVLIGFPLNYSFLWLVSLIVSVFCFCLLISFLDHLHYVQKNLKTVSEEGEELQCSEIMSVLTVRCEFFIVDS